MATSEAYELDENGKPVKAQSTKRPTTPKGSNATAPKAKAKSKAKAEGAENAEGKGAPRPRKYDYGIRPQNMVSAIVPEEGEVKLKAQEAEGYETAKKGCSVDDFLANHDRGILRRLSRKGLVQITGEDGTKYPRPYVAPEPKAEPAKEDAAEK